MKTHFTLWIFILVILLPVGAAAQDKLKIKDPGGNVLMEVRPDGVMIRKATTTERLAVVGLTSAENGLMMYDTDTKSIWLWRDTQWIEIDGVDLVNDADHDPTNELDTWATLPGIPSGLADGVDNVDDADHDPTNELDTWATLPGIPSGFADGVDNVDDADHDPTNELDTWATLPGIPSVFTDGVDNVDDADHDPTNELDTWSTLPGIPSVFADGVDNVDDADHDPTNELQTWSNLPGIPAGFADGTDNVDDADHDPTNELDTWSTLPGIPAGFADGTDNVNDADSDPLNEKNTALTRNGQLIELTDAGGTLAAPIGWAIAAGTVFNNGDNIGIGISAPAARLHVVGGAVLIGGTTGVTPVSGAGTRMMWVPGKQAFRAGVVNSSQWDASNIGSRSFVGGGLDNTASGLNSIVVGGAFGSAIAESAFVGGGNSNTASGVNSFVGGGLLNAASGFTSFASGRENTALGNNSFVGGGFDNNTTAGDAFVGGGSSNTASGGTSFVAGGLSNVASGYASFASGRHNTATASHSFTGGGIDNIASGENSVVAGGSLDSATANDAFVGGGYNNTASEASAFVGGGSSNTASGGTSFVGGGYLNTASGYASFAAGRESTASGNHSFAGGYGLLAKSFNETVFGTYNTDYTPVNTGGYANADRLFVIGKGTGNGARSNAMTILKSGNVGIGTDVPQTALHVMANKGLGEHVMLIENTNYEGSGLKIKINGSHPIYVQGDGENPDFFITRPITPLETILEDVGGDIRDYLLSDQGFSLANLNFSEIGDPAGLIDQMGLTEFLSGGVCKGVSSLVDLANNTLLQPFYLPDLPLDGLAADLANIPAIPLIPTVAPFSIDIPDPPAVWIPWPVGEYVGFTIPNVNFPATTINAPINTFNSGISTVNSGITTVNNGLETGYDFLKNGLTTIDHYQVTPPQLTMPESLGFIDCPNPNPWDNFDIAFERLNPFSYNILNPLSNDNEFITFVDNYDNRLGAIRAESIAEFNLRYFKLAKVLEIGSYVVGLFSVDGSLVKNVLKLTGEAVSYYRATDKMGVEYSSGHGDYAEWLERADHTEFLDYGDIVGIRGGKVSLTLDDAEQVMVVSKAPIVLGNIPDLGKEINGNNIAFIGQVPVKVMGPVNTGDYIVANAATPRYGIAVPDNEITPEQLALAVGRSWETNQKPGFKFVNTIVGMHNNGWAAPVTKLQQRVEANEAALQLLTARLDNLENNSSVAQVSKRSKL